MNLPTQKPRARGAALFFAWSLLLLTALFLVRVVLDARLATFGVIADGVVTKIEMTTTYGGGGTSRRSSESRSEYLRRRDRQSGASTSYHATVRFTPGSENEPRDFKTVSTFGHDLKVGDAVKVIHMASNPGAAEIYSAKQVWLPLAVGIIVTTLCGTLSWFLLRVARRMKSVNG